GVAPASIDGGADAAGATCRLEGDRAYFAPCITSESCGDVSRCIRLCKSCETRCRVPCTTDGDCSAVGAGTCTHYTITSDGYTNTFGYCEGPPMRCPQGGGAGGSGSGGSAGGGGGA